MSLEMLEQLIVLHGRLVVELLLAYLRKSSRLNDAVPSQGSRLGSVNKGTTLEHATKNMPVVNGKTPVTMSCHEEEMKMPKSSTQDDNPQQAKKPGSREQKLEKKVFVRNINFRTSQRELWDHFEIFGKVKHCRILRTTKYTHSRSRGMAIISFLEGEGVAHALSASTEELTLDGRVLTVEKAEKKERTAKQWPGAEEESWLSSDVTNAHNDVTSGDATPAWVYDGTADTPIHRLNEDTLLTIFSYLPLRERVRVECVCSRWRHVALRSWQTLQHFNASDTIFNFKGIRDKDVKWLLRKMNPDCLRTVNLSAAGRLLTDVSLDEIGRHCPNLREADISKIGASNRGLKAMAERCPHLESVKIDNCHYLGEDGFWWLFHRCKELRQISLVNSKRLKGQCFHVLGNNLQILVLTGCSKLQDVGISKIASRCPELTDLTLDECYKLTDAIFTHITQGCKNLRRLSLKSMAEVTETGLKLIGELPTLEELHLESNLLQVTDGVVVAIARGCRNLRLLNLTCCYEVTKTGIAALGHCRHLTELRLSYLHLVSDAGILPVVKLGQLQKLICRGCGALGDDGMAQVANLCTRLELLDISGCDQLSEVTLDTFIATNPIRRSHLTIISGGTHMAVPTETDCDNLTVSHLNLSDRRLRRDADLFFNMEPFSEDEEDDDGDFADPDIGVDGGAYGWGYGEAECDFEDFMDNDDPLQYEHWDMG